MSVPDQLAQACAIVSFGLAVLGWARLQQAKPKPHHYELPELGARRRKFKGYRRQKGRR